MISLKPWVRTTQLNDIAIHVAGCTKEPKLNQLLNKMVSQCILNAAGDKLCPVSVICGHT